MKIYSWNFVGISM